jgi:hypothetical protein|tara:strand:+ start:12740 stop:13306 length:567 start_codon:yes stop_codon:yes gene_type:complete
MGWGIFKQNMKSYMGAEGGSPSQADFAAKLTKEYDNCVKSFGTQNPNLSKIQKGNPSGMELMVKACLAEGFAKQSGSFPWIKKLGPAVKLYWTGLTLQGPPPPPPAPGSIANIQFVTGNCTNPGQWSVDIPTPPNEDVMIFIDGFVTAAQTHLTTVSGIINTVSLYPAGPSPVPGPGVIMWSTFTVPG